MLRSFLEYLVVHRVSTHTLENYVLALKAFPVNIRNDLKWFKHLQNVFKTYLNAILWFSKRFLHSLYKHFY